MRLWSSRLPSVRAGLPLAAVLMLATACGGSSEPSPDPGVITVRGTERLGWNQVGDVAAIRFRAYVDDRPVDLDAAACDSATPEANCTSPLPPLTNGIHSIALTAVDKIYGLESERSVRITVQMISGMTASATAGATAAFTAPGPRPGSLRLETVVATSDGLAYAVDIVATGVKAPAQLAWTPDGRLFVAEADGRVRVVRPGEEESGEAALDARALLEPPPLGPPGLALHPDFSRNHFVYVSFVAQEAPRERTLLRLIRLREVGGTLGEPETLFEALLTSDAVGRECDESDGTAAGSAAGVPRDGPRLAFGPDRLLYVALPPGVEFDGEPGASTPQAFMLRLQDDGRVPVGMAALAGVVAHPIAFDWHPSTGALWALFPSDSGEAVLRPLTEGACLRRCRGRERDTALGGRRRATVRCPAVSANPGGPARAGAGLRGRAGERGAQRRQVRRAGSDRRTCSPGCSVASATSWRATEERCSWRRGTATGLGAWGSPTMTWSCDSRRGRPDEGEMDKGLTAQPLRRKSSSGLTRPTRCGASQRLALPTQGLAAPGSCRRPEPLQ